MLCELINPSDPYTLETENFAAAGVVIGMIFSGHVGLASQDGTLKTPILFGWPQWESEQKIDAQFFLNPRNYVDAITALESVLIGSFRDRELLLDAISRMNDTDRSAYIEKWHDTKRSSIRDLRQACFDNANAMRCSMNNYLPNPTAIHQASLLLDAHDKAGTSLMPVPSLPTDELSVAQQSGESHEDHN